MNINESLEFLRFIVNKEIGTRITPNEGNQALKRAQLEYFNDIYGQVTALKLQSSHPSPGFRSQDIGVSHDKSRYTLEALRPFIVNDQDIDADSDGVADFPVNFAHLIEFRASTSTTTNPVVIDIVRADEFTNRLESEINPVNTNNPIAKYVADGLLVRPSQLFDTRHKIDYYRKPNDPVWAFTLDANQRPIYDSGNSTDFEFDDIHHTNIIMRAARYYAPHLKDAALDNYTSREISSGN